MKRLLVIVVLLIGLMASPSSALVTQTVTLQNGRTTGIQPVYLEADCRLHSIHSGGRVGAESGRRPRWVIVWDHRSNDPKWVTVSEVRLSGSTKNVGRPYVYTGWSLGTDQSFTTGSFTTTDELRINFFRWNIEGRTDGGIFIREHLLIDGVLLPTFTYRCHLISTQGKPLGG